MTPNAISIRFQSIRSISNPISIRFRSDFGPLQKPHVMVPEDWGYQVRLSHPRQKSHVTVREEWGYEGWLPFRKAIVKFLQPPPQMVNILPKEHPRPPESKNGDLLHRKHQKVFFLPKKVMHYSHCRFPVCGARSAE